MESNRHTPRECGWLRTATAIAALGAVFTVAIPQGLAATPPLAIAVPNRSGEVASVAAEFPVVLEVPGLNFKLMKEAFGVLADVGVTAVPAVALIGHGFGGVVSSSGHGSTIFDAKSAPSPRYLAYGKLLELANESKTQLGAVSFWTLACDGAVSWIDGKNACRTTGKHDIPICAFVGDVTRYKLRPRNGTGKLPATAATYQASHESANCCTQSEAKVPVFSVQAEVQLGTPAVGAKCQDAAISALTTLAGGSWSVEAAPPDQGPTKVARLALKLNVGASAGVAGRTEWVRAQVGQVGGTSYAYIIPMGVSPKRKCNARVLLKKSATP